jgi:hypothetical protein
MEQKTFLAASPINTAKTDSGNEIGLCAAKLSAFQRSPTMEMSADEPVESDSPTSDWLHCLWSSWYKKMREVRSRSRYH